MVPEGTAPTVPVLLTVVVAGQAAAPTLQAAPKRALQVCVLFARLLQPAVIDGLITALV